MGATLGPQDIETVANRGVLYITKGSTYRREAVVSARQVNRVMPDLPIAIITDHHPDADCFDEVIIDDSQWKKSDKPRGLQRTPFDRTLYLDTDVWLAEPISELFDMLDRFDMAALMEETAYTEPELTISGVPESLSVFNTGLIAYRSSAVVDEMFADWEERCNPDDEYDQVTFRPALYYSDIRISPLPRRYNLRPVYNGFVEGKVKVLHGALIDREDGVYVQIPGVTETINITTERRHYWGHRDTVLMQQESKPTERIRATVQRLRKLRKSVGTRQTIKSAVKELVKRS